MNRQIALRLASGLIALVSVLAARGQNLYRSVYTIQGEHITLSRWGSGTIAETTETAYEGAHSIRVVSRNFFQGGTLNLDVPVDLKSKFNDPNSLLRVILRSRALEVVHPDAAPGAPGTGPARRGPRPGDPGYGGPGPGGPPPETGFAGGYGFRQRGRGMGPGGRGPGGMGPGFGPVAPPPPPAEAKMSVLRLVVTTTDDKKSEIYIPLNDTRPDQDGWYQLAFPLQAIKGFDGTNMVVKKVALSADTLATFYLGTTPIEGDIYVKVSGVGDDWEVVPSANVALEDVVTFRSYGTAGATLIKYEWNFDAANHPGEVDAVGPVLKRTFRQPGTFTITLTMSDRFGLKKPVVKSMLVTVNPG